MIKVWDPFVRFFHWALAIGFTIAYLTEDVLTVHVWAGYLIGSLLLIRVIWGVVGPHHARFGDFIYSPRMVLTYLRDLPLSRARRYLGHSPAGGAMVIALLIALSATVVTGLIVYAESERAGPLSPFLASRPVVPPPSDGQGQSRRRGPGSEMREVHEVMANLTLALIFLHIAGVLLASFVHRENLAWSMVTGRKRDES